MHCSCVCLDACFDVGLVSSLSLRAALLLSLLPASCLSVFSWDTIPSNAFPGFISHPFTSSEWAYFQNFSSLDVCAVNVTCADGSPADCPPPNGYPCRCGSGYDFETNMEASTIAFAETAAQLHPGSATFPYVYFTSSETWFIGGAAFNRPENAEMVSKSCCCRTSKHPNASPSTAVDDQRRRHTGAHANHTGL